MRPLTSVMRQRRAAKRKLAQKPKWLHRENIRFSRTRLEQEEDNKVLLTPATPVYIN